MAGSNIAAVLHGPKDLRMEELPILEPGPGEVQLSMCHAGICGTDVHFWDEGHIGDRCVRDPICLGHEGAGLVIKVGEGVSHLKAGDRVAIEPIIPCMQPRCDMCRNGYCHVCPTKAIKSITTHGLLQRFHVHDAAFCHKLPDHVSTEEGALVEPLAVAVHACRLAGIKYGDTVLITGAGTIGFTNLLTAKAFGATKVCVIARKENRLADAKRLGADYILQVASGEDENNVAQKIEKLLGGKPNITFECTGASAWVSLAVRVTKSKGCVVLEGENVENSAKFPLNDVVTREIRIIGSVIYVNEYPMALEMVGSGKVNVKPLVTHRYDLEDAPTAFETAHARVGIKVMVKCESK